MEYVEEYRGHRLNAWTEAQAAGWTWSFTIDSETLAANPGEPVADEAAALHAAIAEARRRIDAWPTA
ncbi:MAG: hypothetical protein JSR59_11495 [Proteobacteria bacterium]|nr:hypothetical protein [Pseudomonadota bacterium]